MRLPGYILLVIALLAAMLPCSHAMLDHGHGHAAGPCAFAHDPCECHSCGHAPCSDEVKIQLNQTPVAKSIEAPSIAAPLFVFAQAKPVITHALPPVSGILSDLQTVQLLI